MKFTDKVAFGKRVVDRNGFVSVPAVITRVGIQQYGVDELRRDVSLEGALNGKTGLVNVFRPPETVFNPLTIDSFKNMPVTFLHPDDGVTPYNARSYIGGHIGEDVGKMSDRDLGCTIHLHDKDVIDISFGIETSAGYECPIIQEDGEYEGEKYHFRFDGPMLANHLALVPAGRCGPECKVLDKKQEIIMKLDTEALTQVQEEVKPLITAAVEAAVAPAVAAAVDALKIGDTAATAVKTALDSAKAQAIADAAVIAKTDAVHAKVKPLLGSKFDATKSCHDLLVMAVGDLVADADKKSDEYLNDKVDEIVAERAKAVITKSDASVKIINLKAFGN